MTISSLKQFKLNLLDNIGRLCFIFIVLRHRQPILYQYRNTGVRGEVSKIGENGLLSWYLRSSTSVYGYQLAWPWHVFSNKQVSQQILLNAFLTIGILLHIGEKSGLQSKGSIEGWPRRICLSTKYTQYHI